MDSLIRGGAATLLTPVRGPADRFGADSTEYDEVPVEGVLFEPAGTSDLGAERPSGTRAAATLHWPKGAPRPVAGSVVRIGRAEYRVIGSPAPYVTSNVPGPWDMAVEVEAVDG